MGKLIVLDDFRVERVEEKLRRERVARRAREIEKIFIRAFCKANPTEIKSRKNAREGVDSEHCSVDRLSKT